MASKKKEVKPIPVGLAAVLLLAALAAMGTFVYYIVGHTGETSDADKVVDQSFTEESNNEPAPIVGEEKEFFNDAEVGDIVKFGSFEQNGNSADGTEAIEWQVLAKEDGKLLVISRYALGCEVYNNERADVSWADCSLRKWLSESFASVAFTAEEAELILENQTAEGVSDKLFVLSPEEAETYFEHNSWRVASGCEQAVSDGAYSKGNGCWWWLRNSGEASSYAPYVNYNGSVVSGGFAVDYDAVAVRPAMWVITDTEADDSSAESGSEGSESSVSSGSETETP